MRSARWVYDMSRHAGNARRAAATARSSSSRPAAGQRANTRPVAGLITSRLDDEFAAAPSISSEKSVRMSAPWEVTSAGCDDMRDLPITISNHSRTRAQLITGDHAIQRPAIHIENGCGPHDVAVRARQQMRDVALLDPVSYTHL